MRAISGIFRAVAITCVLPWAIAACSANGAGPGGGDDDDDDGEPPPVINDGPAATVTVNTASTPALIAFRDGTGASWVTPAAAGPGRYDFVVHGPYTVAVVCSTAGHTEVTELARTPDDPRELTIACSFAATTPPRLHVTGSMTQAAQLALGRAQTVTTGDQLQFDLAVDPGTYDLVVKTIAPPGQDQVVIRRDQVITASTQLSPTLDPDREKLPLVEIPLVVSNTQPDESTTVAARLITSTTATGLATGRTASSVRVLASSALRPTDIQSVRASGSVVKMDGQYFVRLRTVEHLLGSGPAPELALPPTLDSVQFSVVDDQLRATWSTLPDHDTVEVAVSVKPGINHRKVLSLGYIKATGVSSATLDTRLPGYNAAWKVDLAGPYQRKIVTQATQADSTGSVSLRDEDANMLPGTGRSRR
jgi:hypothetical protein